jgi:peptidoglycan/LPS O-acetylase OafA/YrhL
MVFVSMQQPKMGLFSTPTEFLTTILCALLLLIVGERGAKPSMVTVIAYVALASAAYIVVLDTAEKEQGTFRCVRSTARASCVTAFDPI